MHYLLVCSIGYGLMASTVDTGVGKEAKKVKMQIKKMQIMIQTISADKDRKCYQWKIKEY